MAPGQGELGIECQCLSQQFDGLDIARPIGGVGRLSLKKLRVGLEIPGRALLDSTLLIRRETGLQGTGDLLRDLAVYEPTETHPAYRQSVIHNFCNLPSSCSESDGVTYRTIEVLIKLNLIEAVNDEDFLAIGNFDAVAMAIRAIRYEEEGDNGKAEEFILKAVREMAFEDRNKMPPRQATVRVNPVGNTILSPL